MTPLTPQEVRNLLPGTKLMCIKSGSGVISGETYILCKKLNLHLLAVGREDQPTIHSATAFGTRFSLMEEPITDKEAREAHSLPSPEDALKFMMRGKL